MIHVLIGAALAAAQIAAPAAADAGETRRDVRVATADLDLSTREGIAALDRRLAKAVAKACGTAYYLEPEELNAVDRCRAAARERTASMRTALLARSAGGLAQAKRASK